jgi:hypothetical protein
VAVGVAGAGGRRVFRFDGIGIGGEDYFHRLTPFLNLNF